MVKALSINNYDLSTLQKRAAILHIAAILAKIHARYFIICTIYLQQLFLGSNNCLSNFHILLNTCIGSYSWIAWPVKVASII